MFLTNKTNVFLSGSPWHYGFHPYRSLYARGLAGKNTVIWFNPPVRNPLRFLRALAGNPRKDGGVRVFTPWCTRPQYEGLSRFDIFVLALQMRLVGGFQSTPKHVLWLVYRSNPGIAATFPRAFRIYWPGDTFDPVEELDEMRHYDLIMPLTEPKLEVVRGRYPGKAMLSTTGCDFDAFRSADAISDASVDARFEGIQGPIVGYAGHLSAYRVDFELLGHLCAMMPDVSFVIAGAQDGEPATQEAVKRLETRYGNIHFIGGFAYQELPHLIKRFTVGIIPYRMNDFNLGTNPNKLYEYFAMGKPVVSSPLPSLGKFESRLVLASDSDQFVTGVRNYIEVEEDREAREVRVAIAKECSPEESLKRIEAFISKSFGDRHLANVPA